MASARQNSQRHIFMADDDQDDRELFAEALSAVDPSVILTQAQDGMQLLEILNAAAGPLPEVIFLDINMPGKSGLDCLEEIRRQQGRTGEVHVIMFSTSSDPQNMDKAMELGAAFYAVKPSSFETLKEFVEDVLSIDWRAAAAGRKFRLL